MADLTIAQVREKFPQYNDLNDQQLADALHQKFYSDLDRPDFYSRIGFVPSGAPDTSPLPQSNSALPDSAGPDEFSRQANELNFRAPPIPALPRQAPSPLEQPPAPDSIVNLMVRPPPKETEVDLAELTSVPRGRRRTSVSDAPSSPSPSRTRQPVGDLGSRFARGATEIGAGVLEAGVHREGDPIPAFPEMVEAQTSRQRSITGQLDFINGLLESGLDPQGNALLPADKVALEDQKSVLTDQLRQSQAAVGALTSKPPNDWAESRSFEAGDALRQASLELFGTPDPQFDERFLGKLAEGAGSMTAFVGVAIMTGPLGAAGAGSAVNSSGMYRRAIQEGATEEQARAAAYIGAAVGTSEALPITRALGQLPSKLRNQATSALSRRLTNAFLTAGEEGVQEALVEIANNLTAKGVYNPDQQIITPEVGESALIGAILGGGLGAVSPTPREPSQQEPSADQGDEPSQPPQTTVGEPQPQFPPVEEEPRPAAPTAAPPPPVKPDERERQPDTLPVETSGQGLDDRQAKPNDQTRPNQSQGEPVGGTAPPPAAGAVPPIDPAEWQEIQGMQGGDLTGRTYMENKRTGEVLPRAEFDRRRAVQTAADVRAGNVEGVSLSNADTPTGEGKKTAEQQGGPNDPNPETPPDSIPDEPDAPSAGAAETNGLPVADPVDGPAARSDASLDVRDSGGDPRPPAPDAGPGAQPEGKQAELDAAGNATDPGAAGDRAAPPVDAGNARAPAEPDVAPKNEGQAGETSPAPSMKSLWDRMTPDERRDLMRQMPGTTTRDGALNKTAERVASKAWDKITPGARGKLEERWAGIKDTERFLAQTQEQQQAEVEAAQAEAEAAVPSQNNVATPPNADLLNAIDDTEDGRWWNGLPDSDKVRVLREAGYDKAKGRGVNWGIIGKDGRDKILAAKKRLDGSTPTAETDPAFKSAKDNGRLEVVTVTPESEGAKIDAAAAEADPTPTEGQKEAGNYKKGHTSWQGLDITIENAKDSNRSGTDASGKTWSVKMPAHYGYIKRTEGADGDHVDVYIGDNLNADTVYVIDQIDAETQAFDEHKVMIGFANANAASTAHTRAFSDGRGGARRGAITPMTLQDFKDWLSDGDTKTAVAKKPEVSNSTPLSEEGTATVRLARRLVDMLAEGKLPKTNAQLMKVAAEVYGGTIAEGAFSPKDAYDAAELALNLTVQRLNQEQDAYDPIGDANRAKANAEGLESLVNQFPTQTRRDSETDAFQQFSTPPHYAFAVNWVANIKQSDRVLEPSAGNGGIAVFALNAGATVDVNEVAARRVPSLKALGFNKLSSEDAEQIANIWDGKADRAYDVVVMNPPFSAAGSRGTKNTSATGARHIEQALDLLQSGGRLVAIMGHTFQPGNSRVKPFFKGLEEDGYTLQANVVVDGSRVYKKYGTGYDSRLLVIDKAPPSEGHETLTGNAASIAELLEMLEDVRDVADNRKPSRRRDGEAGKDTSGTPGRGADEASREPGVSEPQRDTQPDDLAGQPDRADRPRGPSDTDGDRARAEKGNAGDVPGKAAGPDGGSRPGDSGGKSDRGSKGKSLRLKDAEEAQVEEMGGGFAKYRPSRVRLEGAKEHPMLLVESSAMATVKPPRPEYDLKLPQKMVKDGLLSEAQLEQVIYAGAAHSETLPAREAGGAERRKGYFIGDGTGVGKTREIAGIIADNWAQGRKKHILVSKDKKLIKGARRDFDNVGMKRVQIEDLGKTKAAGKIASDYQGVQFTTYSTLGQTPKSGNKSRIEQLVDWVGEDFDGTIIFDEAHLAGNAIPIKGKRGMSKPSKAALAVVDLQNALPNARVVYASATGATEVYNLAYADRLGLWGPGTPFPTVMSFVNQIVKGGIAAMEVVARDMKQMGVYMARGLSYEGVEYDKVQHDLTPDQMAMYDTAATAWQKILQNMEAAIADHTKGGGRQSAAAKAQFWGTHQRFFQQVLTSMQMPSVLASIKADVKAGMSPVIQIVNTNEAATDRAIASLTDGETLDDVDITPRDQIIQYLENSFPVDQFEEYVDEDGNTRTRPVLDSKGNPVKNKKAVAMRDTLVNDLSAIMLPGNPLDMLIETFGPDNVAEVTGRTKRIITKNGNRVIDKRSQAKAMGEAADFQGGKRDLLVFSDAGGTGMDFHADKGAKNNARRAHYILQAGWRADRAIQGFGRTHRTNQVQPPIYKLAGTNLSGHKRFTSSIARRLDQLGALTKGQKDAGGGMFDATDNLENEFAEAAVQSLFMEIERGGVPDFTMDEVEKQLGLNLYTPEGGFSISKIPEVPTFLNRLLNVNIAMQNQLFDRFIGHMQNAIQYAVENGEFTAGVEEVKHDGARLDETKDAYRDPATGATSEYRMLTLTRKVQTVAFEDLADAYTNITWKRHRETGLVYGFRPASSRTNDRGEVVPTYHRHSPTDRNVVDSTNYRFEYDLLKRDEAETQWEEQRAQAPRTREETMHMVTGALLPIWDRLPASSPRIQRVKIDDGRSFLGRVIPDVELTETLANLGVDGPSFDLDPERMIQEAMAGKTILLSSGHKITRRKVGGEQRVEIISSPTTNYQDFASMGGTFAAAGFDLERIQYRSRAFIANSDKGVQALTRFMQGKNVVNVTTAKDRRASANISNDLLASAPYQALRRALDKMGLSNVELRLDTSIAHEGGFYADHFGRMAITIANTTNARLTLGHEALHAFRHMGVISEAQWKVVSREAARTWMDQFDIAARYPDLTRVEQIEEAVAEAFGQFHYSKTQPDAQTDGLIRSAFRRISQMLKAIGNWARGLGLQSPEDVFQALMSGDVQKKDQTPSQVPIAKQRRRVNNKVEGGLHLPDRYVWDSLAHTNGNIFQRLGEAKRALGDRLDLVRTRVQDRVLPVRRAQEAIERKYGKALDDDLNVYLAEEMYYGRAGEKLDFIDREYTSKIIDKIGAAKGVTVESVGEYLYARHAEERNRKIAEINPEFEDGGSGMETAMARATLDAFQKGPHASTYQEIATLIDDLREWGIAERVRMGLMTEREAETWRSAYKTYVPLKGWAETDFADAELDIRGVGRTYNTRGQETRRAMGRGSEAFNPLIAALTQAQEVAVRAEKNRVGQTLYRLIKEIPAKNLWEIKKAETVRIFNETTGLVEQRSLSPLSLIQANNEVAVKVDGKEHRIVLNDPRLARAITQVGVESLPTWMIPVAMFSRYISAVNTMLDPEFIIRNFARDTVTANINIQSKDKGSAIQKGMMRDLPKALMGAWRGLGGDGDTEWSNYFREFSEAGGKVSFWVMETPEASRNTVRARLRREAGGWSGKALAIITPSTSLNPILQGIERANLAVDNAIRLSAFVNARRQGYSVAQAASLAKNLTVNFNRRGDYGSAINAAYVFANAAMQGSHILLKAMKSSKVRKIVFGMYVAGVMLDLANAYLSEEDEDGELAYDKIPDWKAQMNLIIMAGRGAGDAATIWLPYGYNIFPYMGQQTGKVLRGVKEPKDAIGDVFAGTLQAFSPIQGKDAFSTLTPTLLDMANEYASNEDWLGRPIRPESPFSDYGPDAYKYFRGVSSTSRAISDALNRATGGNTAEPGLIDISPEYIDHAFGQLTGGAGRFVGRNTDLVTKLARGETEEIEARNVPLYRALQTDTGGWLDRTRYYAFRESVRAARARQRIGVEARQPVHESTRKLAGLHTAVNATDRRLRELREQKRAIDARADWSPSEKSRRRAEIEKVETGVFLAFNRQYIALMGRQGE